MPKGKEGGGGSGSVIGTGSGGSGGGSSGGSGGGSGNTGGTGGTYTPPPSGDSASNLQKERQERREERRQRIENIRGRRSELRLRRTRSRLLPVGLSLLGQPLAEVARLPDVLIERWNRGTNQTISDSTWTTVQYGSEVIVMDRLGYPAIYNSSSNLWVVPPGMAGVWEMHMIVQFEANSTGNRRVRINRNSGTIIGEYQQNPGSGAFSLSVAVKQTLDVDDTIQFQVFQSSTGNLAITGGNEINHADMTFLGR